MEHQIANFAVSVGARNAAEVYAAARERLQHLTPKTPCRWREFFAYVLHADRTEAIARIDAVLQEQDRLIRMTEDQKEENHYHDRRKRPGPKVRDQ